MTAETPVRLPATPVAPPRRRQWPWHGGFVAAYASETGTQHARNEDCCSHVPSAEMPVFCGVADGVGGGAHGEIASSALLAHCARAPRDVYRNPAKLIEWVNRADAEVRAAIALRTDRAGAATLAAAWFPAWGEVHVVNVGDCRVYRSQPQRSRCLIERVTRDQTYAALGQRPPANGRADDPARMVGAGAVGTPRVERVRLGERDLLLLCSDGVHKFVADSEIAEIVGQQLADEKPLKAICAALVARAKHNGGHDDASALLVQRRQRFIGRWLWACAVLVALLVGLALLQSAHAETQSVIDPTAVPAPPSAKKQEQSDAETKRAQARAAAEQRKREKAEARARAAEKAAEELRAAEEARQAEADDKTAKAAAAKAAAAKKAAARQAAIRAAATRAAEARDEAAREAAAKQAAEKETAARETAIREEAAKELAVRQAAAKDAATRLAALKEAAAKEAAAKEAAARAAERPGTVFRDCPECPEMVWLPRGEFMMGETPEIGVAGPMHPVKINYPLAAGRFEVTFAEWDACVAAQGCRHWPDDQGWGRGRRPVINVSWVDAKEYVAWLSGKTGRHYRLLSEAEWEYAARGGTQTRYWWGNDVGRNHANCYGCGSRWDGRQTAPVGSFEANPFGLYDVLGNASEWVEDCYHGSYRDAPADGSAWLQKCPAELRDKRVMRGGAWQYPAQLTRPAFRTAFSNGYYDLRIGFRVARTD